MSYRKSHIKSSIRRIKPKKSILKSKWLWISVLILIVVSVALYFLLFYSKVQVANIVVSGNQKVASEDIISLVSDDINNKFSRSIFLVDPDKLEKELSAKFPEIESVKVNRKFFQSIEVGIIERAPVAVFCPLIGETGCYFMDASGIIFESAPEVPHGRLIVRQMTGGSQVSEGKASIDKNIMDSVLKIEKDLKDNFQIDLKEALVRSLIRLDVSTSESWKIYFDTSSDINLQITKLNLLLSNEISESQRKNLRYINLIPESKAIICDNPTCGG